MALNKPLAISTVANVLGVASSDLGTLCKSDKVNKWSFHKPVRSNKVSALNESDIYSVDSGLSIDIYNTPVDAFVARAPTSIGGYNLRWNYLQPRGIISNEFYRLLDFYLYNHNTSEWFTMIQDVSSVPDNGTMKTTFSHSDYDITILSNFNALTEIRGSTLYFGIIISSSATNTLGSYSGYYYKLAQIGADWSTVKNALYMTVSGASNKPLLGIQYYAVPVITTYSGGGDDFINLTTIMESPTIWKWIPISCNPLSFNIYSYTQTVANAITLVPSTSNILITNDGSGHYEMTLYSLLITAALISSAYSNVYVTARLSVFPFPTTYIATTNQGTLDYGTNTTLTTSAYIWQFTEGTTTIDTVVADDYYTHHGCTVGDKILYVYFQKLIGSTWYDAGIWYYNITQNFWVV